MTIANDTQNTSGDNATIEVINDSKYQKEFAITTDATTIIGEVDAEIAERAKTFKLAGFRQGAVPTSIVKRQIGESVIAKHINQTIQKIIVKIAKENKIDPSGVPSVDIKEFDQTKTLKFNVKFNILPPVPEIDLTSDDLKIETLKLDVKQDDIQQAKDALVKMIIPFKDAADDHIITSGDGVVLDFFGTIDGEEFEGNKATQIRINIGEGQFIKDFEDKLIGMKKNDDQTITVTFPQDYHDVKIAGKEVDFKIKIHEIMIPDKDTDIEGELKKRFWCRYHRKIRRNSQRKNY